MATTTSKFHHKPYETISPLNPANNQHGKTVLITGSTAGIGFAIATAFIQANARHVILTGRSRDRLDKAVEQLTMISSSVKTTISAYVHDINNEDDAQRLADTLYADNINVDVVVLNAADAAFGTAVPLKPFISQLRTAMTSNVFSNLAVVEYFLQNVTKDWNSPPKTLINISSFMAHSNPAPNQTVYSTSKATFAHILQLLSDEIPSSHCRIINVHPGGILTKELPQEIVDNVVWDDAQLPGAFAVWASTKQADFLHGRFTWSNWDVDELASRKSEFADPGYLKLGLQGAEHVNIGTIFGKVREQDKLRA